MRVLGIVCSPRKEGNTEIMVRESLVAASEAGAETDLFLISEKKVTLCDACGSCEKTGVCRVKDDMQELYGKLDCADGIILGTPVYFSNVSAQCKAILDRTFCLRRDRRLNGKVAGVIVAARRVGAGQVRNLLFSYFVAFGTIVAGSAIGYGRERGEVKTGVGGAHGVLAMEESHNLGINVVRMIQRLNRP